VEAGASTKERPEPPGPPWPVPPPGGGHARESPQGRYYRPCMAGTTGHMLAGTSRARTPRGRGGGPVPQAGASTQGLAGTSGHGTGQGTARTPEPPGYFASFDAFSGTSTGTSARGTARTRFSSDLNR
jgi:hypothetical protein